MLHYNKQYTKPHFISMGTKSSKMGGV